MARLKEKVELQPYGERSEIFSGEIDDSIATFFIESGKANAEDFEELPTGLTKKPAKVDPKKTK